MPYKDPEKRKEAIAKSREKSYPPIAIRFSKSEPKVYESLMQASENDRTTMAEYMRQATKEKLVRDGYIPEVE